MSVNKNPEKIKKIFDEISSYYDFMNNVISFGMHYLIKFLAIKELQIEPRTMVLDLCCGTGDFTKIISKFYPKARVIGFDISEKMIKLAKNKNPLGVFMQGDCSNLPFENGEFDYVTMGFGLRNIENRDKTISEIYKVLKKGGKFMQLDFGEHNLISKIFDFIVPLEVKLFNKKAQNYEYLLKSKKEFPKPDELIMEFEKHGFKYVKKCNFLFGVISAQIVEK